jgi:anti-anti-sigma factor
MQASVHTDGAKAAIKLAGRFDFNTHRDFHNICDPLIANREVREIAIDFDEVDYLDSSALGMLLMLRDKVGGAGKDVVLTGVRGNVKQVLDIANFGKLFKIS